MVFSNCGLLGDMFLCLPVLSWHYKTFNQKVTFALSTHFPYSRDAQELLEMQECIEKVIYFDYTPEIHEYRESDKVMGQYHILSSALNEFNDEVISLGFHGWPDKYIPEFYAEEYGLGVDYDFKLNYGTPNYWYHDHIVKIDKFEKPQLLDVDGINLACDNSIIMNLQLAAGAKEVITFTTGFSIMATLARIPIILYQPHHLIEHHKMYFDINGGIENRYI
jgi:hypothetical protein